MQHRSWNWPCTYDMSANVVGHRHAAALQMSWRTILACPDSCFPPATSLNTVGEANTTSLQPWLQTLSLLLHFLDKDDMYSTSLLSSPSAVILLLCVAPLLAEPQWPHNLPRHLKYFPEDEARARRGLEVQQKMMKERPIGVKKLSTDPGEMFMLDNWIFASDLHSPSDVGDLGNETDQVLSPLRPITENDFFSRIRIRDILLGRQFACPEGTASCTSIGAPDVCCFTGSTCINTNSNSDAGSIGCCPNGQTCAGPVHCDTSAGYSSCPGSSNGGCCLPGFRCQGVGCLFLTRSILFHVNTDLHQVFTKEHRQVLSHDLHPQLPLRHLPLLLS